MKQPTPGYVVRGSLFQYRGFLAGNRNDDFKRFYARIHDVVNRVYRRPRVRFELLDTAGMHHGEQAFRYFLAGKTERPLEVVVLCTIYDEDDQVIRELEFTHYLTAIPWVEVATMVLNPPSAKNYGDEETWYQAHRNDMSSGDAVKMMEFALYLLGPASFSWSSGHLRGTRAGLYLRLKSAAWLKTLRETHEDRQPSFLYQLFEDVAEVLSPGRSDFLTMKQDMLGDETFCSSCERLLLGSWGRSRFVRNMDLLNKPMVES